MNSELSRTDASLNTSQMVNSSQMMDSFETSVVFAALETARVGLCVIDDSGTVVLITNEFSKKINQIPSDLLGRSVRRLLAAGNIFVANFTELVALSSAEVGAQAAVNANGKTSVLLLRGETLIHPHFGRFRILSILDIDDFGISPTRLLETRREIDAMRSAVVIADLRQPDAPITFVNRRFEEMTGYNASEVVGRNCRFLQGADRSQGAIEATRRAIAKREPCHVVVRNYRKNGESFLNELFIAPLMDLNGEVTHLMGLQKEFGERQFSL